MYLVVKLFFHSIIISFLGLGLGLGICLGCQVHYQYKKYKQ